jgi:hypothetical protein
MLITCYYDIYPTKPERFVEYLTLFYDLALSGIPILLFTDPALVSKFCIFSSVETLRIIPIPLTEFRLYQQAMSYTRDLPAHRTPKKDTKEFYALMNTKMEFIQRAMEYTEDETLIWIDYGILKIVKNQERFLQKLREVNETRFSKLTLPGCWSFGRTLLVDSIHWRFCGGFFVMPRSLAERFYQHSICVLRDFCTFPQYKLTWETNVWTVIESCAERENMDWYFADHNDTIVLNIQEWLDKAKEKRREDIL